MSEAQTQWRELMLRKEELCDELRPYVTDGPLGAKMVHHPLIIELSYDPERCAMLNYRYGLFKAEVEKAKADSDWHRYVWRHERPYRFQALCNVPPSQRDAKLVGSVWTDSENIWQHQSKWLKLWKSVPNPADAMDEEERRIFDALPHKFEVFRGIRDKGYNKKGMSWTLDQGKAVWFSRRWRKGLKPSVLRTTVVKPEVFVYFGCRGESEIVVDNSKLTGISVEATET